METSLFKLLSKFKINIGFSSFLLYFSSLPTSFTFSLILATLRIDLQLDLTSFRSHSSTLTFPVFTGLPLLSLPYAPSSLIPLSLRDRTVATCRPLILGVHGSRTTQAREVPTVAWRFPMQPGTVG